jgi:hypothetical protein
MRKNTFHAGPYDGKYSPDKSLRFSNPLRSWPEKEKIYKRRMSRARCGSKYDVSSQYPADHALMRRTYTPTNSSASDPNSSSSDPEEVEKALLKRQSGILEKMYENADKPEEEKEPDNVPEWLKWVDQNVVKPAGSALEMLAPNTMLENLEIAEQRARERLDAATNPPETFQARRQQHAAEILRQERGQRLERFVYRGRRLGPLVVNASVLFLLANLIKGAAADPVSNTTGIPFDTEDSEGPTLLGHILKFLFFHLILDPLKITQSALIAPFAWILSFSKPLESLYIFLKFCATIILDWIYSHIVDHIVKFQVHGLAFVLGILLLKLLFRTPAFVQRLLWPLLRATEDLLGIPGILTAHASVFFEWLFYRSLVVCVGLGCAAVSVACIAGRGTAEVVSKVARFVAVDVVWNYAGPSALLYYDSCMYNSPLAHQMSLKIFRKRNVFYLWVAALAANWTWMWWLDIWYYYKYPLVVSGPWSTEKVATVYVLN